MTAANRGMIHCFNSGCRCVVAHPKYVCEKGSRAQWSSVSLPAWGTSGSATDWSILDWQTGKMAWTPTLTSGTYGGALEGGGRQRKDSLGVIAQYGVKTFDLTWPPIWIVSQQHCLHSRPHTLQQCWRVPWSGCSSTQAICPEWDPTLEEKCVKSQT